MIINWRRIVPSEFVEEICPYPGAVVMKRLREKQKKKASERAAAKSLEKGTSRKKKKTPAKRKTIIHITVHNYRYC